MLLYDLLESLDYPNVVPLDELSGVPEKALGVLTRLAKFHNVANLSFDRKAKTWLATDSAGLTPFVQDAKHITSAAGIGTKMANENK